MKAEALDASFVGAVLPPAPVAVARPALSRPEGVARGGNVFADSYLRRGIDSEIKSFNAVNAADGGFALPREIDAQIEVLLKAASPIRQIANVVRVSTAGYRKLVTANGTGSGWAAENGARPETSTPQFNEVIPNFGELYANPAATQAMLEDAAFDVEAWLASEIAAEFAKAEGAAFVNGNGTNKPKGFLTATLSANPDTSRAFGQLQYVASGAAGGFAANPQDKLVDLVQTLRAPYRQGAVWLMNAATVAAVRKFKTTDGAFIWQPGMVAGAAQTLLGYPVIESEDMPDIAANALSIAFGNFQHGYVIADRSETSVLRDPYSNKPFVHFYATRRVGGTIANSEAIKLLRFSLS